MRPYALGNVLQSDINPSEGDRLGGGGPHFRITELGVQEPIVQPESISTSYLNRFDEFREFRTRSVDAAGETAVASVSSTPQEAIENAIEEINAQLTRELLDTRCW